MGGEVLNRVYSISALHITEKTLCQAKSFIKSVLRILLSAVEPGFILINVA